MKYKNINKYAEAFVDAVEILLKIAKIRKLPNGQYRVLSEKGKNLGTYKTQEEAKKRLRQVEFFKHKNANYSEIVRNMKKDENYSDDDVKKFQGVFKKNFDYCWEDGEENPEEKAIEMMKKK
jgi:hypothetical protein